MLSKYAQALRYRAYNLPAPTLQENLYTEKPILLGK